MIWHWFTESHRLRRLKLANMVLKSKVASLEQQCQDLADVAESMRRWREAEVALAINTAAQLGFSREKPR